MSTPNSFILHAHYEKQLKMLNMEQRGLLITALFDYQITNKVPEIEDSVVQMAFSFIAEQMDYDRSVYEKKCEQNRNSANKRWSASKSCSENNGSMRTHPNACEPMPSDAKLCLSNSNSNSNSNSDSDSNSDSNSDCESDRTEADAPCGAGTRARAKNKKTEEKKFYGQYGNVRLSDSEMLSLRAEFPDLDRRIERLSEYIASVGDRYKSHAATIRAWSKNGRDGSGGNSGSYGYGYSKGKPKSEEKESSFDTDEFFEAALARAQRYMEGNKMQE